MRRFTSPGWITGHVLVVVACLVCLRLAWWQLDRSEQADGTIQNTGYALLWPAFAVAFIYMWIRFLRLEQQRLSEEEDEHRDALERMWAEAESLTGGPLHEAAPSADPEFPAPNGTMGGSAGPADVDAATSLDDEEDAELAAYNRALAALAEKDRRAR